MKIKSLLLTILGIFLFVNIGLAEGQQGMGTLIIIMCAFSFLAYVLVGGLLISLFIALFKTWKPLSKWIPFFISFTITVVLTLTLKEDFLFAFW